MSVFCRQSSGFAHRSSPEASLPFLISYVDLCFLCSVREEGGPLCLCEPRRDPGPGLPPATRVTQAGAGSSCSTPPWRMKQQQNRTYPGPQGPFLLTKP